jgi:flagellar motor switch protein FliN/FliY
MSDNFSDDQDKMADEWAAAMAEQGVEGGQDDIDALMAQSAPAPRPAAERAPLDEFDAPARQQRPGAPDLDVILDIPVRISMEVGNTEITIRNLLQLNQGSVIELDRLAGEPLDVLVNGTLIAHGEVVVVNEKFGIRMTDVISPSERIKKLR